MCLLGDSLKPVTPSDRCCVSCKIRCVYQNTPKMYQPSHIVVCTEASITSNIPVCWTSEWWWCWSLSVRPTVGGSQVTRDSTILQDWWFCSEYSQSFNSHLHASYTCGHSSHGWQMCSLHFQRYYFIITIISDLLSNILQYLIKCLRPEHIL